MITVTSSHCNLIPTCYNSIFCQGLALLFLLAMDWCSSQCPVSLSCFLRLSLTPPHPNSISLSFPSVACFTSAFSPCAPPCLLSSFLHYCFLSSLSPYVLVTQKTYLGTPAAFQGLSVSQCKELCSPAHGGAPSTESRTWDVQNSQYLLLIDFVRNYF